MNIRKLNDVLFYAEQLEARADRLVKTIRSDAEFHEEDHPRASDGRFGEKAGVSEGKTTRGQIVRANLSVNEKLVKQAPSFIRDEREVDQLIEKCGKTQQSKFTEEENKAIDDYFDYSFKDINSMLNSDVTISNPDVQRNLNKQTRLLDRVIKKSGIPVAVPVFRGVRASLQQLTGSSDPQVGSCFVHRGYSSVSRSEAAASEFAEDGPEGVLLKFTLPAGTPALPMPDQEIEKELLLPRNAVFRVDKIEKKSDMFVVHVSYLGIREK